MIFKTFIVLLFGGITNNLISQNVGINILNPKYKLTVGGTTISDSLGVGLFRPTSEFTVNGGGINIYGTKYLEFGKGITKEINAGKIGYNVFSDALDIVGAGTLPNNRKLKFWAEGGSQFFGDILVDSSFTTDKLLSTNPLLLSMAMPDLTLTNKIGYPSLYVGSLSIDASNTCGTQSSIGSFPSSWQSFTATNSGILYYVELFQSSQNDITSIKLYAGEGVVEDSLLSETSMYHNGAISGNSWSKSGYLGVPIIVGRKYTIWANTYSGWSFCNNSYAEGRAGFNVAFDFAFKTILYNNNIPQLIVAQNGNVGIGLANPTQKLEVTSITKSIITKTQRIGINVPLISSTATFHINGNLLLNGRLQMGGDNNSFGFTECYKNVIYNNTAKNSLVIEAMGSVYSGGRRMSIESRGGLEITGSLQVNNTLSAQSLSNVDTLKLLNWKAGNESITLNKNQTGTLAVTSDIIALRIIPFTFPVAFSTPPKIIVTAANQNNILQQFAVTTTNITTTGATLLVRRIDVDASWTQTVQVNWWAFE